MVSVVDVTGQVREGQLPWAVGSGAEGGPGRCLRGPGQVRVTTIRTGASVQLRRPGEGCSLRIRVRVLGLLGSWSDGEKHVTRTLQWSGK